jgi:hypothetical protein
MGIIQPVDSAKNKRFGAAMAGKSRGQNRIDSRPATLLLAVSLSAFAGIVAGASDKATLGFSDVSELVRASDHDPSSVPLGVFAGTTTGIEAGTFLKAPGGPFTTVEGSTGNRPTDHVWLASAAIFGVSLPSLGAAKQYTGPLVGLVG